MKCQLENRESRIDDFLLERMSVAESKAFEAHIFECLSCLEEIRIKEQIVTKLKADRAHLTVEQSRTKLQQEIVSSPKYKISHVTSHKRTYLTAFVLLFLTAVSFKLFVYKTTDERFSTNPWLEQMMVQTRSLGGYSVAVNTPIRGETYSDSIMFNFEISKNHTVLSTPVDLVVMDNKERHIHAAKVSQGRYLLPVTLTPPGLYYWTIEVNGETQYLGKFFIKP